MKPPHGLPTLDQVKLGVVCPMANEARNAVRFVESVLAECDRSRFASVSVFVVVDHVSRDDTRAVLDRYAEREPRLRVVWAPETRGVADAYVRGYRAALAAGCDWVLEIDAGFSHSPADINAFFIAMSDGYDCVFGSRFMAGGRNVGTLKRRLISRGGTVLTNLLLGTRLSDMTSGFELFRRAALEEVVARGVRSHGPFFQTEVKARCRRLRVAEVPISYTSGSHTIGSGAISESFANLWWLFGERVRSRL